MIKLSMAHKITIQLVARLEELIDDFNKQGAENQSTQLSGLLDDYYMAMEEIEDNDGR